MLTNKKGWSIVEVIMAVIIIGILVGIFIPSYRSAIEESVSGKAVQNLRAVRQAEIHYYANNQQYTSDLAVLGPLVGANLSTLLPLPAVATANGDPWGYQIAGLGADNQAFTVTATRISGKFKDQTITLDELDQWGGAYPINGPW